MRAVTCAVLLGAICVAGWPAAAQQRSEPGPTRSAQSGGNRPPAAPAQAPAPAAAPAQQAPQAQPAPQAAPPAPQPVRTEIVVHDNWTVTCREFADKRRTCSATLQVVQSQNNQVLFVWIIGKNSDQKVMSVLQTPTGISLAPGVEVKLTRGNPRKAVYVNCESNRCEATLDLDDGFVRDASASDNVEATIYGTNGQGVKFTLPFKGFDKAYAAVR